MTEIEKAKEVLRAAGYFTDNLWHIDDVKLRFAVFDDEDAQAILETALTNDWIMEQIHYGIGEAATDEGFKELENED
jgi:hypothetical protein